MLRYRKRLSRRKYWLPKKWSSGSSPRDPPSLPCSPCPAAPPGTGGPGLPSGGQRELPRLQLSPELELRRFPRTAKRRRLRAARPPFSRTTVCLGPRLFGTGRQRRLYFGSPRSGGRLGFAGSAAPHRFILRLLPPSKGCRLLQPLLLGRQGGYFLGEEARGRNLLPPGSHRGAPEGEQRGPAALTCGPWGRLPAEGLGQCPAPGFSLSRSPKTSGNFGVTPPDPQRSSTSARNIAQGTEILQRGGLMQCTPPVQRPAPGHAWAPTGTRVHGGGVGEGALGTSCGQGSCHYLAAVNTARSAPSCPCLICFANKYSWDIETLASDYCFEL